MEGTVHILEDTPALYRATAERIVTIGNTALRRKGSFHLALAGGSTPQGLYQLLGSEPFSRQLDWRRVHIYFGDERCVPPDHEESNYRMAREALLSHVPVPNVQIHPIPGDLPPPMAAGEYNAELERHLPRDETGRSRFDLILLGVGADGHIASLFPDSEILRRRKVDVDAVYAEHLSSWRISLTLPAINRAHHLLLLVSGSKKADVLRHIARSIPDAKPLPVQLLQPEGEMEWFLDRDAALYLPGERPA